jgi:integrase
MPSAWIDRRGDKWRVRYRIGGRESPKLYGGTFRRKADAETRCRVIEGDLARLRVPDLQALSAAQAARVPTLAEAAEQWRASRVDVAEQTRNMHRAAFARIFKVRPKLRSTRVDALAFADVADLIGALHDAGYKRETLRKTRTALAQTIDYFDIVPNVARDDRVKLPKERRPHIPPPLAEHVETVAGLVAREYVLPLLVIDWAGPRVSELETAQVVDLDEGRKATRVRPTFEKNERYRHLDLPDDLFSAIVATLPPREDRNPDAPLFPGLTDANLRMAITRACKAGGVPHFSPHGLRRRRGSLHYKRTGSLAEVAELLGDSKRVASDHYVYALTDHREIERQPALERLFT